MTQPDTEGQTGGSNIVESDYCCGEGQSLGGCGGAYTEEDLSDLPGTEKAPDLSQRPLRESED